MKEIETKDYVTKSNLPFCDYVINPYSGCLHGCKYCYASFMKRFTGHDEPWGSYEDVKVCGKPLSKKRLEGKAVFLSSVTDPYNPAERKFEVTRGLLEQLADIDCTLYISTKSDLILRDIDLLKRQPNAVVALSLNTLDDGFRKDMERASSIQERLDALRKLHDEGIYTVLFMSPMFPGITDFKEIIEATSPYIDEYWFENLNLRGAYKKAVMDYIQEKRPELLTLYRTIYDDGDVAYWKELMREITEYCDANDIKFIDAFNHAKLVADKKRTHKLVRSDRSKIVGADAK